MAKVSTLTKTIRAFAAQENKSRANEIALPILTKLLLGFVADSFY